MSVDNHHITNDIKIIKSEKVHEAFPSTRVDFSNSKTHGFVKCCKNKSLRKFDDKHLETFNNFTKSGKLFQLIVYLLFF